MKLTLLITTNNDTVVSQNIVTEWDIKKNPMEFFGKLEQYMHKHIIEHNKKNAIHIKSLECFHEDGTLLMTMGETE
jgi:hypothetical protein